MKKEILKAFLIIAVVSNASSAFAVTSITSAGTSIGSQVFKPSNNVQLRVTSSTSAWAAMDSHSNGDRAYSSFAGDPKVYWSAGTTLTDPTADSSFTGWNSL